jgi:protein ImuA
MDAAKATIITQLKKDIHALQGFKTTRGNTALDTGLGVIKNAFPDGEFPLGAVHEFIAAGREDATATTGFVSGLLAALMQQNGAAIWISNHRTIFPPALKLFGLQPERIIFIELTKEKEILWAMEEALKCKGLAAVVCEIPELSFMISRRLQLAVEQSQVTGFILRNNPRKINTTACVTRWKITTLPSALPAGMPGVGFPAWNVELLKVRSGKPGKWEIEFAAGRFRHLAPAPSIKTIPLSQQKKTG